MTLKEENASRMLGEVQELYDDAVSYFRIKRLDRAVENTLLYRGYRETWRDGFHPTSLMDVESEANEGANISRMLVRAAVAQTLKQFPSLEVPASKDDQKARAKADFTEKLGRSILKRMDQDELHRTVSWAKTTGASWLKCYWNMDAGRPLPSNYDGFTDAEEKARWSDDGFGGKAATQLYEGDVTFEFVPTVDGFPDPSAKTIREIQHFFHTKLLPIRKLEDRFTEDYYGKETKGRFSVGGEANLEQRIGMDVAGDGHGWESSGSTADSNTYAELTEFWEMPTKRFPLGRFIAFSGSMILSMGPNPYYPARIPFILFQGDNIVPGSLYSDGLLEDVKPFQYSTNRVLNKMREHLDKLLNVHILNPFGSGIEANTWGDKSGQIINYAKGLKPEPLEVRDIPQSMFSYLEEQIRRAQTITGYTDVGRGESQGDLSGRAVAFYTENEQSMREPDMASHRRALLSSVQQAIYLYRQFADDGRLLHMIGDNGKTELTYFREDDYDWDNDFVPEVYSGRPMSRSARMSEVMELMAADVFNDQNPGSKIAQKLLGDEYAYAAAYEPFPEDRARAKRENLDHLKNPQSILSVKTYDTHWIHIEEHRRYMRTVEFEQLPEEQQKMMMVHDALHEMMAMGGEQATAGMEQPGQPPPQPGPEGQPPGVESPPNGGANIDPAPPPSVGEFAQMDESEQRSTDQQ